MKKHRKPGEEKREECPRVLRLYAPFSAPGKKRAGDVQETLVFEESLGEAQALRNQWKVANLRAREKERRVEQRRSRKLMAMLKETVAVHKAREAGEIDEGTASRRLREICPDPATQLEVVQFFYPALEEKWSMTDEQWAAKRNKHTAEKLELERRKRDLAEELKLIDAVGQAHQAFQFLSSRVLAGDQKAIQDTASLAERATTLLMTATKLHPATTVKVAAYHLHWPVLGSREPGWERTAAVQMETLQLGSGLESFHTRFRVPRGADENYPARQWAKAAVRTIEETRWRGTMYRIYEQEFKMLFMGRKHTFCVQPEWVQKANLLPEFSANGVREWGKVIREMVREQVPDFHNAPEWESHRRTAEHNCRSARGEIQNAILDDIVSALGPLAPQVRDKMPKSGS